jgi:hypothetical protein
MRVLFLFMDGVGLGAEDPNTNPFSRAAMPVLSELLGGRRMTALAAPYRGPAATLLPLDAGLGVEGMPQSGSGQAALLTGRNVPALVGGHYGPWPSAAIVDLLANGGLFGELLAAGRTARFLNAYPPSYFAAIASRRRVYSSVPRAVVSAGLPLPGIDALQNETALSADLTGMGWRERLGISGVPLISPREAGARLACLARAVDFSFFEYWLSDYAGHRRDMDAACKLLETWDEMLGGLLDAWSGNEGIVLLTSDHGNLEDLSSRGHTTNPVPLLLVGSPAARERFAAEEIDDLTDVAPAILRALA